MDATAAIRFNHLALKRILAGLVAMAGLGGGQKTLPRHLWRAVLRLLRPAESAARRLIIAAARGLVVPPPGRRKPKPASMEPLLRRFGIAVVLSPACPTGAVAARAARIRAAGPLSLPLFDPPRRPWRHHLVPAHAAPRILLPGIIEPFALPPPPAPDDLVSAARLGRRLAALAAALDDLPGHARRFARRQAFLLHAAVARDSNAPAARRTTPIRRGRPPGGRLLGYDPDRPGRRGIRDIDEILAHAHALALHALDHPDTS